MYYFSVKFSLLGSRKNLTTVFFQKRENPTAKTARMALGREKPPTLGPFLFFWLFWAKVKSPGRLRLFKNTRDYLRLEFRPNGKKVYPNPSPGAGRDFYAQGPQ
jgi:hypothetical protein